MALVEIYTGTFCGHCGRARRVFERRGVRYTEINVNFDERRRAEMVERSGGRNSVPQVFVDGVHIGGADDLIRFEAAGRLDELLATSDEEA